MTYLITLVAAALLVLSAPTPGFGAPSLATEIQRTLQQEQLAGAVWAVVTPDGGAVAGAAGLANADSGAAMRADNRVQVGSVAKVAVAAGVLRLITEGKLSLDTPVATLLPGVSFTNRWEATDPIRVRHLLSHTAGLENFRLWHIFSQTARADTPLSAAFANVSSDPALLTVQARPGSRFAYSNIGYTLLGMVIEAVGGQRYDRYLDAQLLQPLGMRDSTFGFVTQTGPEADPRLAMGHFEHGVTHAAVRNYLPSADRLTTTAADMARFAAFLMGDGSIDGRPFIDPRLMAQLGTPSGTEAVRAGLTTGHGHALVGRDRHGQLGYCHPGTTVGFNAMLCVYPEQRKAFFVAMNTDSETADYDRFNKLLIDALRLKPAALAVKPGAPADDLADWLGIYVPAMHRVSNLAWTDIVFNFIQVSREDGLLRLAPFQGKPTVLTPTGGHLFTQAGRLDNTHVMLIGDDGQRIVSDGIRNYAKADMVLFTGLWVSLGIGLLGLAYIVTIGCWRLLRKRLKARDPLFAPLMGVLALALPAPLFYLQSFMRMGELTMASGTLALVTAALPLTLAAGLAMQWRGGRREVADTLALIAGLQCILVLAAWGMLPLMLWK
ncbi:serine hydrolase domain-containing protein [Burkholderia sp. LMU1-1-1.1]|uniref:serine hydrolase domain-containing protein n=1 Tax=Burkholderia sp. LMU1-1-1.1 TaxID=3135266 RepID=UPI00341FC5AF